jgi:Flp pilus assembly protein TadD
MRVLSCAVLCLAGALALAGCKKPGDLDVSKSSDAINVVDSANMNDIMLTIADPAEAVSYFTRSSKENPDRIDLMRGLAKSLVRAKRPTEATIVFRKMERMEGFSREDRVDYAETLIRVGEWEMAESQLNQVPPTFETYKRYRLEAMIADSNREWKKADSFYESAIGLATQPAGVLNNWGYSKLTRGEYSNAERLFTEAITYNSDLFTAKNNLVLSRVAQRKYTLPLIQLNQIEKAELLHTMALGAIKQGDTDIGRGLLEEAIDTHPRHFDAAVRSMQALNKNVVN